MPTPSKKYSYLGLTPSLRKTDEQLLLSREASFADMTHDFQVIVRDPLPAFPGASVVDKTRDGDGCRVGGCPARLQLP